MGRIARSFELVAQSYRVLMQDRELMILPLLSGAVTVAVFAVAGLGLYVWQVTPEQWGARAYAPAFAFYVVTYAIGIFFQAAVVAGATERLRGGDPTVSSALAAASRRAGAILMWAVVAATVGMLLRALQERVGLIGKFVVGLVGMAWSLATLFVVPVIVLEDRPVTDSIWRSSEVFKETWGETVAGSVGLGAAAVCAWLVLIAASALLAMVIGPWALALFAIGALVLMIFFAALQGVYVASLFRYATGGDAGGGLDRSLLSQAFVPKR